MDADTRHVIEALLSKVQALKMQLESRDSGMNEAIAIVGIGCRFPGEASSPAAFWELLETGRDVATPLAERWSTVGASPPAAGPGWASLLTEPVDQFDAAFFGISPREAQTLDPQQRLLLEVVWEALEEAGIPPESLAGSRAGVFVAACSNDYSQTILRQPRSERDLYAATGNALSVVSGRVSYALGLEGPCMTVDAACSSSLVAVHLACRSLRDRESDVALAGGVSLILSPDTMEGMQRLLAMAPDGRCRTFDAMASGMARGEGCGVVVLKRLADAVRDGDRVWGLIRGSAVNQNGRSTGLSVPNASAQEAVLREALRNARVNASAIGYVETHGAGSPLADPVEVEALRAVVGTERPDGSRCVLGALKTNVGSLEAAGGIAGLVKVALSLRHERIPQNLHFRTLNPAICLDDTSLDLAVDEVPWPRGARPRFAGVSAFGMSGTNAHVILEESPSEASRKSSSVVRSAELVVLSARSEEALKVQASRLEAHLATHPDVELSDVAFSLATTRSAMDRRLAVPVTSRSHLRDALDALVRGVNPPGAVRGRALASPRVVFAFTGCGTDEGDSRDWLRWRGLGLELLAEEPVFRAALERCGQAIRHEAGWSILDTLAAPPETSHLERMDVRAPALFALETALAALWQSWGVTPDALFGEGAGELAAAYVAEMLSLEDAVAVACHSSRLLEWVADREKGRGPDATLDVLQGGGLVLRMSESRERASMLETLGALWVKGHPVAWPCVFPPACARVPLPTYAWQRERHWVDVAIASDFSIASDVAAPEERGWLFGRLSVCDPRARAELLEQFLTEQVSRVLRMAPDRLDVNAPLGPLGMDSITGLALRNHLETALGVTVPAALSRTYPTLSAIASGLIEQVFPDPALGGRSVGHAIRFRAVGAPRARLYCFHGAGGSPELFADWSTSAPRDVDVVGMWHMRNPSSGEQPSERYLDDVTALLLGDPDVPFALVGLSLGGAYAWRVARELAERAPGRVPEAVFVVGSPIEHPGAGSGERADFLARLYDQRIVGYRKAMEQVETDIEADLHLATALGFPAASPRVAIPIVAFGGENDPLVPPGVIHGWSALTKATFTERLFPGDHAFMIERQAEIFRAILGHFEGLLRRRDGQANGGHRPRRPVSPGVPSP